jgi:hypothetical protein
MAETAWIVRRWVQSASTELESTMLHVLTVHWQDDRWIDIQLAYLRRNIAGPFKVYAFLNGVPDYHREKFFYSSVEPIKSHPVKLNLLADIAALHATSEDDLLMFLDGDAFAIADVVKFAGEKLAHYPIAAVQRLENDGDIQPHPCFCITTVGFWKSIQGDWKSGYHWKNKRGETVTDVGGNMLEVLRRLSVGWYPVLRTNKTNLHPLWFGLYGDVVYHHGAGFRDPESRFDYRMVCKRWEWLIFQSFNRISEKRGLRSFRKKWNFMRRIVRRRFVTQNETLSSKVFELIRQDPQFYRLFQEPGGHHYLFSKIDLAPASGSDYFFYR